MRRSSCQLRRLRYLSDHCCLLRKSHSTSAPGELAGPRDGECAAGRDAAQTCEHGSRQRDAEALGHCAPVVSRPDASPWVLSGAAFMRARVFGDWKRPWPLAVRIRRQTMSPMVLVASLIKALGGGWNPSEKVRLDNFAPRAASVPNPAGGVACSCGNLPVR